MRYEITLSGRRGIESEDQAREVVRLLISALKVGGMSYNIDVWNTAKNAVFMAIHGNASELPEITVAAPTPI